jgi:hypothetical protein
VHCSSCVQHAAVSAAALQIATMHSRNAGSMHCCR